MSKLINALEDLRYDLQEKERRKTGRRPAVCSDKSLLEMVDLMPTRVEDLKSITGVGKVFIDSYGKYFIELLNSFEEQKLIKIDESANSILDVWEKKLIKISRSNKNLYMGKVLQNFGIDATRIKKSDAIVSLLTDPRARKLTLAKNTDIDENDKRSMYRNLNKVYRGVESSQRESGIYNLYVGYPYVEGKLAGEDFNIKAPLMLTPVILRRVNGDFTLERDFYKDIELNTDLILTNIKYNGKKIEIDSDLLSNPDHKSIEDILEIYKAHSLEVTGEFNNGAEEFFENTSDEFPDYKRGELTLKSYMVLGLYSMDNSALHSDFKQIVERNEINGLINELIHSADELSGNPLLEVENNNEFSSPVEEQLSYINQLNYSQEKILSTLDDKDSLVVQGPPGTGKSQTITSLVANQIFNNNNVLIVSEKKTALDVIYSRLGNNSKYAIMVDDVKNKSAFYNQLEKLFNYIDGEKPSSLDDINRFNTNIQKKIDGLNSVVDLYFSEQELIGASFNDIFPRYKKEYLKNPAEILLIKKVSELLEEHQLTHYPALKILEEKLNKRDLYTNVVNYKYLIGANPIYFDLFKGMDDFKLTSMISIITNFKEAKAMYDKTHFFKKRKIKKLFKENNLECFNDITDKLDINDMFSKHNNYINQLENIYNSYDQIIESEFAFNELEEHEKKFMDFMMLVDKLIEGESKVTKVIDYYITYYIHKKESSNKIVANHINKYEETLSDIKSLMDRKRAFNETNLSKVLKRDVLELKENKRFKEILKRVQSKRKMNPIRFLDIYRTEIFGAIKVWMMTPETVSQLLPLKAGLFDLVVFDESSQMYVERAIPTIYRAKKVCIAGDSMQLKPTSLGIGRIEEEFDEDDVSSDSFNADSLLDVAKYRYPELMLNCHYRSKYEELIAFSNKAFYKGKLLVAPNFTKALNPPIEYLKVEDGMWINQTNPKEAKRVVMLIMELLETRENNETIGVITFNQKQRDEILDEIDRVSRDNPEFNTRLIKELIRKENGEDHSLFIKNIENVQGDERDIIIFSTAYAKDESGKIRNRFGWLSQENGENRLNVAITRAKQKIVIVSSIEPEELNVAGTKNIGPKLLKSYLSYCRYVSNNDMTNAKVVLDGLSLDTSFDSIANTSFLKEDIYEELTKRGFKVEKEVGVAGYSIDMAILDEKTNRYILGIECDANSGNEKYSARESEFHRKNYLEIRGWKIHKVWSPNWWKKKDKEIEKIVELLQDLC